MNGGIYAIHNKVVKSVYVGKTNDFQKRWNTHKRKLNSNTHSNYPLQRDWNFQGEENFLFEILEFCQDEKEQIRLEAHWINEMKNKGYFTYNLMGRYSFFNLYREKNLGLIVPLFGINLTLPGSRMRSGGNCQQYKKENRPMEPINKALSKVNQRTQIDNSPPRSKPSAPQPVCEYCGGQKYYRYDVDIDHVYFGRNFPCPKCNQIEIDYQSGLNTKERTITMGMINTTNRPHTLKMVRAAMNFIESPKGFLSFHGGNGTGKTLAAMAIVNALIGKGIEARYLTASELLAIMRETFNTETAETDYSRIHKFAKIPVLVIDEMDKLRDTPYSREIQQELINLRYREADILGTVLAWNGELNDLPWPAVVSRISEFVVIKNADSDMRKLLGDVQ